MTQPIEPIQRPIAIIGGGNMAQAILAGGLAAGVLTPTRLAVLEPDDERRRLCARLGVIAVAHPAELAEWTLGQDTPDAPVSILLAIKPQVLPTLAGQWAGRLAGTVHRRVVISILAGLPIARVAQAIAVVGFEPAVVRVMPSTPVRVRLGCSAIASAPGVIAREAADVRALFGALGEIVEIPEPMMDAFTAVVGSGPAYVYLLTEAMARGAMDVGFDSATALALARATIRGASAMMDTQPQDPQDLRRAVTSPGGTTAAALDVLDAGGLVPLMSRAILAARDRGRALGSGASGPSPAD